MKLRPIILVLTLVAVPLLAGAQCAFFFSSGGGSSDRDEEDDRKGLTVVVADGYLGDQPVKGIGFRSGPVTGVTGDRGEFQYEVGNRVGFYLGDINLGREVEARERITPGDLAEDDDPVAAANIMRLLRSLDSDPLDKAITIPASVRAEAVRSNEALYSAIEYLDFSDESAFVNAAAQLVAVLTRDYPFTAALLDAQSDGADEGRVGEEVVKSPAAAPSGD